MPAAVQDLTAHNQTAFPLNLDDGDFPTLEVGGVLKFVGLKLRWQRSVCLFTCMYLHLPVLCSMLSLPFCVKSAGSINKKKQHKSICALFKFIIQEITIRIGILIFLTCSLSFHLLPSRSHSPPSDLLSFEVATVACVRKKKKLSSLYHLIIRTPNECLVLFKNHL